MTRLNTKIFLYHERLTHQKSIAPRHTPLLKLKSLQYGHCKSSTKENPRGIDEHSTQHPFLSRICQEEETRAFLITSCQIQEFAAWTQGEGWLKSAQSFRNRSLGEDDARHGRLEEEQLRERSGMGTTRPGRFQPTDRQSLFSAD